MLRKVGFLFALMLTLPAIANAWTLAAKVSGVAGSIQVDAEPALTTGSKYYTVAAATDATVTITSANKIALVTVDGVAKVPVDGVITIDAPVAPKKSSSVVAYFSALTYDVSVSQVAGGSVTAQVLDAAGTKTIGSISRSTIKSLKAGTKVKITALPNADYKATSVAGVGKTSEAGVPQSEVVTVSAVPAENVFTAAFALVPVVKANLVVLTADGAPIGQSIIEGTTIKVDAGGSRANGAVTYAWSGCGATGTASSALITPPAGACTVSVTVTSGGVSAPVASLNLLVRSVKDVADSVCNGCHANRDATLVSQFATSAYKIGGRTINCQDCHSAAPHDLVKCSNCHSNAQSHSFPAGGPTSTGFNMTASTPFCVTCHTPGNDPAVLAKTSCIACHDVAVKHEHPGNYVDDNNGVRAITTEFSKWSHHVTGVTLQDAHCAACHLEGKVENGAIVVDPTKHMADAKTHLRNADDDTDYAWDPATPDHTLMDNFCMSCHDGNGAISTQSAAIRAVIIPAAGKVASATNPFGDTISNRYDKMQRPAVVDAKGQFDLSNPSHHAVMGQKYSGRTRAAGDPRVVKQLVATFDANSSATLVGKRSTIYDSRVVKTAAGTGSNAAYNVSKFVETYETLSVVPGTSDKTLGDDSVLHCGDCHTVGQFRQADVGVAPKNAAVIGAHGSNNEYMLRNSIGTDQRHVGQTYTNSAGKITTYTNEGAPLLVCFNCHSFQAYGSIGNGTGASGTNHAGEYANAERCNGPVNTISFAGYTTSTNDTHEPYAFRLGLGQVDMAGSTKDTDFSNLFGMQCANCHNAGPNNLFGGIHGSKVKTYADANGAAQNAYRFLPGLGNTMYVPGSAAGVGTVSDLNWEVKSIGTVYNTAKTAVVDNGGCYTIVPEEGPGGTNADYALSPAFEQTVDQPAAGTHIFGTWGGCDDHRGNAHGKAFSNNGVPAGDYTGGTVATGGAGVTRKVLRPVTY